MAMNSMSKMAATTLLLVLAIVPAAMAVTFTVGGTDQWASNVDYTEWVKGKTFRVGDSLEFKYGQTHAVDVVNKAAYDACDSSAPLENHSDGDTTIDLKTTGDKYYICPTPGHCLNGMKLKVTVLAASPASPTPPTPTPATPTQVTPSTPETPPAAGTPPTTPETPGSGSTSPPPPPPKGSGATKGVMSYVLVGVSMVFGYGLLM
ncbi:unnamed protein product [Cochlearia groenlandica]